MPAAVIIPARYASTRFPGKPLTPLLGKPMIQHVYERAMASRLAGEVWVATDDHRIAQAVEGFGGKVIMTSSQHSTGTSRVAEAAERVGGDPVVNLQGDEPLIKPAQIDQVIEALRQDSQADVVTLRVLSRDGRAAWDCNCVKVVVDHRQRALYFSRAPIPYHRDACPQVRGPAADASRWGPCWIHVGLYGFSRKCLMAISDLPPSPWERAEQLEQLRFLYWGYNVVVLETAHATVGVDVPEDVSRVERLMVAGDSDVRSAGERTLFQEGAKPTRGDP